MPSQHIEGNAEIQARGFWTRGIRFTWRNRREVVRFRRPFEVVMTVYLVAYRIARHALDVEGGGGDAGGPAAAAGVCGDGRDACGGSGDGTGAARRGNSANITSNTTSTTSSHSSNSAVGAECAMPMISLPIELWDLILEILSDFGGVGGGCPLGSVAPVLITPARQELEQVRAAALRCLAPPFLGVEPNPSPSP
jgi:hypothetical protein